MGGNGSYDEDYGGVLPENRTHTEIEGYRILGHKVLISIDNPTRGSAPMNSNSPDQVYVIGTVGDKRSGKNEGLVSVSSVAFYEGHHIKYSVDVKYDGQGHIKAYSANSGESATHAHEWHEIKPGVWGRVSHSKNNHHPPDARWTRKLVEAIESFNSKKIKWEKK